MDTSDACEYNMINESFLAEKFLNIPVDKDDIVSTWLLTSGPIVPLIVATYLFGIKLGMHMMASRQTFNVTMAIRIYNIFQIVFNIYLLTSVVNNPSVIVLLRKICTVDVQGDDVSQMKLKFLYYFYGFLVSKITDLLDTVSILLILLGASSAYFVGRLTNLQNKNLKHVSFQWTILNISLILVSNVLGPYISNSETITRVFMVLRKKNSHITFLHVYHHSGMVLFSWISMRYAQAFQGAIPGFINVFVHIIMYTYYLLATFGPAVRKYLWWKKHLTKLQLAQFVVILAYLSTLYYYNCPISRVFTYIWSFNVVVFTCLFLNFYIKSYILKSTSKAK